MVLLIFVVACAYGFVGVLGATFPKLRAAWMWGLVLLYAGYKAAQEPSDANVAGVRFALSCLAFSLIH